MMMIERFSSMGLVNRNSHTQSSSMLLVSTAFINSQSSLAHL
ncbi:unnamed protein product [Haemonchus placei]|uniref:Uncharacterized protein n=1 Tax=Haemonchus placei TaxID=6290 RepID=A0A3P7SWN0_HAEPC|nr:unnamed protein product [Haemonchus placei]